MPKASPDPALLAELEARANEIVAAAKKQRDDIVAAAQKQRDEILRQAEMNILALEEDAKQRGYDTGYLEGLATGQREANRLLREAETFLAEGRRIRDEMLEHVEPQVVELAVTIAENLVGRQLAAEPETIVSIVHNALRQLREAGEVVVRLHAEDLPLCREHLPDLQSNLREQSTLHLLVDSGLARGHCRVETSGALIECLLDERFAALRATLADVAGHD
jgi:flagellar biosynthesis/type III secretory pathway protein FliH